MVGNVEVDGKGAQLLELHLVDYYFVFVRQAEHDLAILASAEVFNHPFYSALCKIVVCSILVVYNLLGIAYKLIRRVDIAGRVRS